MNLNGSEVFTVQLPNGVEVRGTYNQVAMILTPLGYGNLLAREGDGKHYRSDSRGVIAISEMDIKHLRNAIAKRMREWSNSMPTSYMNDEAFITSIKTCLDDITLRAMVNEITRKVSLEAIGSRIR